MINTINKDNKKNSSDSPIKKEDAEDENGRLSFGDLHTYKPVPPLFN